MSDAKVTRLRSIELGVRHLARSNDFYKSLWGLQEIAAEPGVVYLRASGSEHHVMTLREMPNPRLLSVAFEAYDRAAVSALHGRAAAAGVTILQQPKELPAIAGGGFGFSFLTPEGQTLTISSDVSRWPEARQGSAIPQDLTHVVLNSASADLETAFFIDTLGFRLSDSTQSMEFIRCSRDHHAVAFARGNGPSLNHMAFKMSDLDELMTASGRMRRNGFDIEWGVGRHGPGNNIFSYFIEPNGYVAEFTTGMQQIDEKTYVPKDAKYWSEYPLRPCRWGLAMNPSAAIKRAFSGALVPPGEEPSQDNRLATDRQKKASASP